MHHTDTLQGKETYQYLGAMAVLVFSGVKSKRSKVKVSTGAGQKARTLAAYRVTGTEPKVAITA